MKNPDLRRIWNAGFTRRWHTHPHLSGTNDFNHGHQGRTAALALALFPDRPRIALKALIHDQGEFAVGDMARPAKSKYPEMKNMLNIAEEEEILEQGFKLDFLMLYPEEEECVWMVDVLDSYLWCKRHKPNLLYANGWTEEREKILEIARKNDVYESVKDFMDSY